MVSKKDVEDYASMAKGVAKTFFLGDSGLGVADKPEQKVDYGEGPAPEPKHMSPPKDFYTGYGAYAPRKPGGSKARRKRQTKR